MTDWTRCTRTKDGRTVEYQDTNRMGLHIFYDPNTRETLLFGPTGARHGGGPGLDPESEWRAHD